MYGKKVRFLVSVGYIFRVCQSQKKGDRGNSEAKLEGIAFADGWEAKKSKYILRSLLQN